MNESNPKVTEFIKEYYKARPQLTPPKATSFGTYEMPRWCNDIMHSLIGAFEIKQQKEE